jgi:soluble lytic murein transglycosylase-like protein
LVDIKIGINKVTTQSGWEFSEIIFNKGESVTGQKSTADGKINESHLIQSNISKYDNALKKASVETGLNCSELKAYAYTESGLSDNIATGIKKSSAGAIGLIQLMPETGKAYGCSIEDLKNPEKNAICGAKFIKDLKTKACNGTTTTSYSCNTTDQKYVMAAYNGGPGSNKESKDCADKTLWECIANTGYKETRYYVLKVEKNWEKIRNNNWGC